jgi:hypothetical protein
MFNKYYIPDTENIEDIYKNKPAAKENFGKHKSLHRRKAI